MADHELDKGFEEVPTDHKLDEGFEEVIAKPVSSADTADLSMLPKEYQGKSLKELKSMPVGEGETGIASFVHQMPGAYQVESAEMAGAQKLKDLVTGDSGKSKDFSDLYKRYQLALRARQEAGSEQNPLPSAVGTGTGFLASIPMYGKLFNGASKLLGMSSKAAPALTKMYQTEGLAPTLAEGAKRAVVGGAKAFPAGLGLGMMSAETPYVGGTPEEKAKTFDHALNTGFLTAGLGAAGTIAGEAAPAVAESKFGQWVANTAAGKAFSKAKELTQKGIALFGDKAEQQAFNDVSDQAMDASKQIQNSIKVGEETAYSPTEAAAKGKTVDLTEWADNASKEAEGLADSKQKEEVLNSINDVVNGKKVEAKIIGGFKPIKEVPETPGTAKELEDEAIKEVEALRHLGVDAKYQIKKSVSPDGRPMVTKIVHTDEPIESAEKIVKGLSESGEPVETTELAPTEFKTTGKAKAKFEEPPTAAHTDIKPIEETTTQRVGGTPTLDLAKAQELDQTLSAHLRDQNFSPADKEFVRAQRDKLRDLMDQNFPGYKDAVEKYSSFKKFSRESEINYENPESIRSTMIKSETDPIAAQKFEDFINQVRKIDPELASQIKELGLEKVKQLGFIKDIQGPSIASLLGKGGITKAIVKSPETAGALAGSLTAKAQRTLVPALSKFGATPGNVSKMLAPSFVPEEESYSTPAGDLTQKPAPKNPSINSPFAPEPTKSKHGYNNGGEVQPEQSSNDTPVKAQTTQLASNLYNATDDSLRQVADHFKSTDALSGYGKQLHKALDDKDENLKNRVVFAIMQNPATRKLITPQ
jgi:hypothetical protein